MKAISFDDIEDLQSKIAELEKERDAANKRAAQAEADARALAELTVDEESPLTDAQRALIAKYTGDAKGN